MKFIHTADWHLGKLVQGVYMTDDQRYALLQLVEAVRQEKPDAVVIAGDLYDRAVPPAEAVELLNELFEAIVIELQTPVIAISGNHDSPDRLEFATKIMEGKGLHLAGQYRDGRLPVVLCDEHGEVWFHLVPYADPGQVRYRLQDEAIRTHEEAMRAITARIGAGMDKQARHVFVGHAFVTPAGEPQDNTSDSERPLAIGGAEHVSAQCFSAFHYTALGHLHQAHFVGSERIQYAGSPLKYSISEERHAKGYLVVVLDAEGRVAVEKRLLAPRRDMRRVEARMEELLTHQPCEDYVYVTLLDEAPVLYPMEKVRTVYPNALHVERRAVIPMDGQAAAEEAGQATMRKEAGPLALFAAFCQEVRGAAPDGQMEQLFAEVYHEVLQEEGDSA